MTAGKTTVNFDDALMDYTADIPDTSLKSLTYNGASVPNFSAATTDYIIYTMTADPGCDCGGSKGYKCTGFD